MIVGIGTDIIEIDRIEKIVAENTTFVKKIFAESEVDYLAQKKYRPESIAGLFAAKEAVSKAMGTGFRNIKMSEIEITHTGLGQPQVVLNGMAKERAEELTVSNICISISHCKKYAIAYVIMEKYT
ncbi:holo-ACP synthase [Candidatus Epulonipiscium viviparus]|uniref:holo-ACP synthase n=1 Tax=Candidatus Epulonipiscium viviparus TaxID=420336 RepID=UPI0027380DCC|nr:holo-ACP synthase [Candidatus Epulopiscium viviparus]